MAAPTTIALSIDQDEYSKFELGRNTIQVSWTASGGGNMSGEVLRFKLIKARRTRDVSVWTQDVTISGITSPQTGTFNIYLPDLESNNLNLIRRGLYLVRGASVSAPAVTADTPDFPISIITAYELRRSNLFGLDLSANAILMCKFQPQALTGITIEQVSANHPMIFAPLTYTYNGTTGVRQLSWGGGPMVQFDHVGQYILKLDCNGSDYIVIRVKSLAMLPAGNVVEEILIEKNTVQDDQVRRWINQACDWWENDKVAVFLEPTRVCTEAVLPGNVIPDFDFIGQPLTFYPVVPARWIEIMFPYPQLQKIELLFGQIANTRIVDVDLSWVEKCCANGMAQLVPFNQQVAFQYIGLVWVESLRGVIELPNFWHFNLIAGLKQVDPVVVEILGKKAAIDALIVAGQAYRRGLASQSISRDGVSESVSYTASAMYGTFGATIEQYNLFINREIKSLRSRYRGFNVMVA